ncbi:unnamed protein product [Eruca vesicaria subsp. sativa]|uniref:Uncharacterized protein n=1 Tax=Eruca vesicaria subsp. sativa TaxID=29727 RepID=A0ABC8M7N8_ERUVS|nr:unnamed protein product [Eruca vesicaria subsp. sativa]
MQKVEEKGDRLPADDNLDLANEVLEAMYISEKDDEMVMEGMEAQAEQKETPNEDDGFENLTDPEDDVENTGNEVAVGSGKVDATAEVKEDGEFVQDKIDGEEGKKHGLKKKPFKAGTVGAGGTKMRMVQAIIAHGKRPSTKAATKQEDGSKKVNEKGSLNPKASTSKD